MTDKNVPSESNIDLAKSELRDLIRFFDSLSCWERDESISAVEDFLDRTPQSDDVSNKQIQKMHEQLKALRASNRIEKQSKINMTSEECLKLRKSIRKKPNYNKSMEVIQSLSKKELIELGSFIGMSEARLSFLKPAELHHLYEEVLTTKSIAIFFACRNYLGREHM